MSDVKSWSTVASENNATPPNGWPENMAPSAVNNSARENMAAIKRAYLNFPYFCPGGTVTYVDDVTFTIADDTLVTDYSQYYKPNRRIKAITPTGPVYGVIGSSTYSSGSTTVKVSMDGESVFPSTVTDVYIGLSSDDTAAFQGPNLLGMVLPWTADPDSLPVGFGLADGTYFDKALYPALEELYDTGEVDPDTGNKIYLHGGEEVNGVWQPKKPDVRGYFPRFLDPRNENALDPDAPRALCSTQDHALQDHTHKASGHPFISGTSGAQYQGVAASGNTDTSGVSEGANVSTETRPVNIALPGLLVMYGGYSSATGIKVEDLLELTEADAHDYIDSLASPIAEAVSEAQGYANDAKGYRNQASGYASDAAAYKPVSGTYTLDAGDWDANNEITVSVTGLLATSTVLIAPSPSADASNETLYAESGIRGLSQANGSLTFKCSQVPADDVSVEVVYFK